MFENAGNRVITSFLFFVFFTAILYLLSMALAFFYLPGYYNPTSYSTQSTVFGYIWYWIFKILYIIWYYGMGIIILFFGGFIDIVLKYVFEPAFKIFNPSFYYSGVEFQTVLTLIRRIGEELLVPLMELGEEMQVTSISALRDLLGGT